MNDAVVQAYVFVANEFASIAVHAESIARGLENVAPATSNSATGSVHYLHAASSQLEMESETISQEGQLNTVNQNFSGLIELVKQAVQTDADFRAKYKVGTKFYFVRDRLLVLLEKLEASLPVEDQGSSGSTESKNCIETKSVYVYLYNAEGAILRTWLAMLTPQAMYEYSVSRPIFLEKKVISDMIALKSNQLQHAYLTVNVMPADVSINENNLIKIKEGSLQLENIMLFTHNGHEFVFERGELMKIN